MLQKSRVKEEIEYLSPYIKQTASVKKNNQPQVCTLKLSSTKPRPKRPKERKPVNHRNRYQNDVGTSEGKTSSIEDKKKVYPYCQKLAEISKQEVDKSEQKRDEEITNESTKSIKIIEDKALEENDKKMLVKVEDESSVKENNVKFTKPLNGETLIHACERWLRWVKDFQLTYKWNEESKIKKSFTTESTKEIANVDNCSQAIIGVKEDEDNVLVFI
ncbi:hypothetical protein C2G38_2320561 [Gigaspora rosea]|uniref:Uncharacterized protein n=1 Tax=Gigaspora rosea TaxID=44941 RepID=A0A397UZD2_9GLOM|nr:hypothetical protein C2G38_2320561 [Gigaspora rosea]